MVLKNSTEEFFHRGTPLHERVKVLRSKGTDEFTRGLMLSRLDEMTIRDLKGDLSVRFQTRWRASHQGLHPKYLGVDKHGTVYFRTNSGTTPGVYWNQKVFLVDFKKALRLQRQDPTMKDRDVVNLAVSGDVRVYCNDPSFLYYGWKYITYQLGAGIEPEDRYPSKRNPNLSGTVCKHLTAVLDVLPFYMSELTRDFRKAGAFSKK